MKTITTLVVLSSVFSCTSPSLAAPAYDIVPLGLDDVEHTRSNGYRRSIAQQLNEAGHVCGSSTRYNGGGGSAWLYNGANTINIGLTSSEYTSHSGHRASSSSQLNEAGQVIGYSQRINGGGQDAWVYDPALDQTFSLQLAMASYGYAYSHADYLGPDGLVLGTYTPIDAFGNRLNPSAFYFTIADGLHDLGSLVEGGLASNGLQWLANVIRANGEGQILGRGFISPDYVLPYLLTPVPEPNGSVIAVFTVLMAALMLGRWHRQRKFSRSLVRRHRTGGVTRSGCRGTIRV